MHTDKQKNILCDCLDMVVMAGFMRNKKERLQLAETLINDLNGYPFIAARISTRVQFAYVKVANARNVLQAYTRGNVSFYVAFVAAKNDLEKAFSILTDK